MPSQYITVKKYNGVCYSESKRHSFRGKPDRIYWVRFRDKHGKLRYEKCGRASEGWTPEAAQQKRYSLLEQERTGEYKPKQKRIKDSITLNQFVDECYLPWTRENHKHPVDDQSRYANWLREPLGNKRLSEISISDIEAVLKGMSQAGKAKATIRQVFSLLRHIFNKAIEQNVWAGLNPCAKMNPPRFDNARQRFLSKEEAEILLTELRKRSNQLAQIAALSLYTGMRRGEIFSLKWQHIDFEHGIINVIDSKNSESRQVFITNPTKQILKEIQKREPHDFVFTNNKRQQLSFLSNSFARTIEYLKWNEGIDDNRQRISFHTLRHTFASWAVMNGVPLYHLAKALGHKSTAMTERYSHLTRDSQRIAFESVANM